MLLGCRTLKEIPVETKIIYEYRDSTRIKDSTVVIPVERIVDVVPVYDSLKMETSMAKVTAWVDTTTHTLKGNLENKQGVVYKTIYKDRIVTKDSLVFRDIPVAVETIKTIHPRYEPFLWLYALISLLLGLLWLYLRYFHK